MVSKIIRTLIALSSLTLFAHDNSNTISANAGTSGLDSAHLKINHQSYFYLPNDDTFILDLNHGLHRKHMQNHMGIAYRKSFDSIGIGANFYYMHSTRPRVWLHQISPGFELFCKDWQASYNLYIPTSKAIVHRSGLLLHSPISEFGLRWSRNHFSIGFLPFYDHLNMKWGLNSSVYYTFKEMYNIGVMPYFKPQGSGCLFSFGISFSTAKAAKPVHRSNSFNYFVKDWRPKNPPIFIEPPKQLPIPTPTIDYPTPTIDYPAPKPAEIEKKEIEDAAEPAPESKETEKEPWKWSDYVPSYYDYYWDNSRPNEKTVVAPAPKTIRSKDLTEEFHWVERADGRLTSDDLLASNSGDHFSSNESTPSQSPEPPTHPHPRIFDDYLPHPPQFNPRHQSSPALRPAEVIEDYNG